MRSPSCWSVVVAATTDVAVLDGIGGGGGGVGKEGLVRMIASHSATVDGPIFSAAASKRAGVQKAYRRCALGMCSGMVVCRCFTLERAWLAIRVPRWNTSMVASVARTSTTWRIRRDGTE